MRKFLMLAVLVGGLVAFGGLQTAQAHGGRSGGGYGGGHHGGGYGGGHHHHHHHHGGYRGGYYGGGYYGGGWGGYNNYYRRPVYGQGLYFSTPGFGVGFGSGGYCW